MTQRKPKNLRQAWRESSESTAETTRILRNLSRVGNELRDRQEDSEHERLHGPSTLQRRIGVGLLRAGRWFWQELIYASFLPRKLFLIVVFNLAAVALLMLVLSWF